MTATTTERRSARKSAPEFRAADDGPGIAEGHAARFGAVATIGDWFRETIAPGAFTKTLQEADVMGLWQHDPHQVLGRSSSGTLELEQDDEGLRYVIQLPNTTLGRDTAELLSRGDVKSSSFAFRTIRQRWEFADDGLDLRIIEEAELIDVSIVTWPAYAEAEAGLRSLAEARSLDADRVLAAARAGNPLPTPQQPESGRPRHRTPAWVY